MEQPYRNTRLVEWYQTFSLGWEPLKHQAQPSRPPETTSSPPQQLHAPMYTSKCCALLPAGLLT